MGRPRQKKSLPPAGEARLAALLAEKRVFQPAAAFRRQANCADPQVYQRAARAPEKFWAEQARQLEWLKPWKKVLEWKPPYAKWFAGGKLNVSVNCLDRHIRDARRNKAALVWEGEPGDRRTYTYWDLWREVNQFANVLKRLGIRKGDRVAIYLPLIPEAAIAMLACARIGAVHSVVFGGFSAEALKDRINDARAKLLITADGGYRRGAPSALKPAVDEAVSKVAADGGEGLVEKVLVVRRTGQAVAWDDSRDVWWHDVVDAASSEHEAELHDSEHPLYVMYTSGTTGKPKGILHTTGGTSPARPTRTGPSSTSRTTTSTGAPPMSAG